MIPVDLPPPDHRPACVAPAWRAERPNSNNNVVSSEYPIRVHWQRAQDEDRAMLALEYAELAWAVQVEELGFQAPILPDDEDGPELDIYFAPVGEWEAYAEPGDYVDSNPGDGRNSTTAHIVIDRNLPEEWVPSYTVHEFNHVTQFATDFSEDTLPIWEGVAVSAQHWTIGYELGEWDLDVGEFQRVPWAPAFTADGYEVYDAADDGWIYEYGAALWVMHIDEVLGAGDGAAGPAIWDGTANEGWQYEPDAVDAVLTASGQSLGSFMNGLGRTRWLTGSEWDERGIEVAADWGTDEAVYVEATLSTADVPGTIDFVHAPQVTGQVFIELDLTGADEPLVAAVTSSDGNHSALLALTWGSDGVGEHTAAGAAPELSIDTFGLDRAVLVVSNLGPEGWDGDDEDWVDGDQRLTLGWGEVALPDPEPDSRACGCDSAAPVGWFGVFLGLFASAARRRRDDC